MKLEIPEAVSLILALPAHRSNNEGHRKMGEKALEFLLEYRNLGCDELETQFNREMIAMVLSTVRAFSVQRDRMAETWKSQEALKNKREKLAADLRDISPLAKGNHWLKVILPVIGVSGISLSVLMSSIPQAQWGLWVGIVIMALLLIELISIIGAHIIITSGEAKHPSNRSHQWQAESMTSYRKIVKDFVQDALWVYKKYYPEITEVCGYPVDDPAEVERLEDELVERKFCF